MPATEGRPRPVTLSSDFDSHYPAAMRGVLARRGIERIHDVTHELPRQDVRQSAFWLAQLLPYFPPAVHCVVVDPGVGTDRDVLAVRAGGHALVGPDNGVLWPTARWLAHPAHPEAYAFDHVEPASATFHGRDVFAPLAAAVATLGVTRFPRLPTLEPAADPEALHLPAARVDDTGVEATVLAVDGFGNVITSADGEVLAGRVGDRVRVDGRLVPVTRRYADVSPGEALVTVGSHGHLELAVNRGRGVDAFDVAVGADVRIGWS
ncbi:MAG: S-adenosyl-l-methionine hydroxide adenosyltransferase family protein [Halobacteriales archaeon]